MPSLEKMLILGLGYRKFKINKDHLVSGVRLLKSEGAEREAGAITGVCHR